jgi:hypothetical protein
MNIFVSRDGQTFGPYSVDQAKQFLEAGQLLDSDYALFEGESEWKNLGVLLGSNFQPINQPIVAPIQPQQTARSSSSKILNKKKSANVKRGGNVRMNRGQSVVITKQKGIFSRIFSTLIVFSVTCLLAGGLVAGFYFAMPTRVGPMLEKFGILSVKNETKKAGTVPVARPVPGNPLEITLNEDDWLRLRSTDIIILPMANGEGFRILSPPERERGLNDDDLEALLPMSREIISLDLTHAEISDQGLITLSKLINLQRLYLEGNKGISVEGIAQLKSLENLSYLNLVRIELNEELVDQLISMENLREIYLFETGLDESSIARLKEARPKVFVNGG